VEAYECVVTKLDYRYYSEKPVPVEVISKVLDAGRLSGTGSNTQHWKFILVRNKDNLQRLAEFSRSGGWVQGANFAVVVVTDPQYGFHKIDAGRAAEDMQLAAWSQGVVSCIYTGINDDLMREGFGIPEGQSPTIVIGFGYPGTKVTGKRKKRKPLEEVAFLEEYGRRLQLNDIG
jgi:nitroreductase